MERNKIGGEYTLILHSIDRHVSSHCLDKHKFTLYTFGRGDKGSKYLSVKLLPDDKDEQGRFYLSSMQCFFAWDPEKKDWVVGNGKPPEKYIPQESKKYFAGVSSGPSGENNRVYACLNASEEQHTAFSNFQPLTMPLECSSVLGIAFLRGEHLTYNKQALRAHSGREENIRGCAPDLPPFAYLIEISPLQDPIASLIVAPEEHP